MKLRYFFLIALFALVGYLAYTNPNEAEFRTFSRDMVEKFFRERTQLPDHSMSGLIQDLASVLAGQMAESLVQRENYFLFSFFTLEVPDAFAHHNWRFLGIGGYFIPLERPEFLENNPHLHP
ncbi:MAG: DUF4359 domain-containing protein [Bacteroidetes Order II. Incertae sedis bacterium]|nr:DUF4359 domain-containing protein [Bacteroidetes Order II. bacterium]